MPGISFLATGSPSLTPVGSLAGDLTTYILSFGVLGIVAIAFFFRLIVPVSVAKEAREQGRQDIKAELDRVLAEKHEVEEQRDAAMKVATEQLVPTLIAFTSATSSLIPLLQTLVSDRERHRDRDPRDR